jgi:WD40 repeat protein
LDVEAALSPDGERVLTWGSGTIKIWDVSKPNEPVAVLEVACRHAAFSRDARRVLTRDDRSAKLWQVGISEPLATLSLRDPPIPALFSKDLSRLITRSEDGIALTAIMPRLYVPPANIPEDNLTLEVEILTGTRLDANGNVVVLSPAEWRDRKQELDMIRGK